METLISWFQSLDDLTILTLVISCLLVLGLIPFHRELVKMWFILTRNEKLKILYFNYGVLPINIDQYKIEKIDNQLIIPDEIIEGSTIYLYWKVEGFLSLKLYPGNRNVSSDITRVNVTRENRIFTLVARGLFKKQLAQIVIPSEKIKVIQSRIMYQNVPKVKYTTANLMSTNFDIENGTSRIGNMKLKIMQFKILYIKKRFHDISYPKEQSLQWNRVIQHFVSKNVLTSFSIRPRLYNEQNNTNL